MPVARQPQKMGSVTATTWLGPEMSSASRTSTLIVVGMPVGASYDDDGRLDVGDRVRAVASIGHVWGPRVPRGTTGIVVGRMPGNMLDVHFDNGRSETVRADRVTAA
jgi:hypothetical protein